ncbi:MAG TPA: hypothetical protein VGF39_16550 [Stellaceae bacterium]
MTKAFDLASFVPAPTPAVGNTVQIAALGPPETTQWAKGFVEAPLNTTLYARSNSAWVPDPIQADAPDAQAYARKAGAWQLLSASAGPPEAPNDAATYGRHALAWVAVVPLSGATMTGTLTLMAGAPVNPADASNKAYVDTTANSVAVSVVAAANIDAGSF